MELKNESSSTGQVDGLKFEVGASRPNVESRSKSNVEGSELKVDGWRPNVHGSKLNVERSKVKRSRQVVLSWRHEAKS